MLDVRILCPQCQKRLKTLDPILVGQQFRCPRCGHAFTVAAQHIVPAEAVGVTASPPPPPARPAPPAPQPVPLPVPATAIAGSPAPPPPARAPLAMAIPEPIPETPPTSRGSLPLLIVAVSAIGLLGIGFAVLLLFTRDKPKEQVVQGTTPATRPQPQPTTPTPPTSTDEEPRPRTISLVSLPVELQSKVDRFIADGVDRLKKSQQRGGLWPDFTGYQMGFTSLAGLTLLECGVPPSDPVVQAAARAVRERAQGLAKTYDVSLAILFLDRLGDKQDRRLIQRLALFLMANQRASGGWTYGHFNYVSLTQDEERQLYEFLGGSRPESLRELFGGDNESIKDMVKADDGDSGLGEKLKPLFTLDRFGKGTIKDDDGKVPLEDLVPRPARRDSLPQKLKNLPVVTSTKEGIRTWTSDSDNSNTQFAILALWAAGRHQVPTERSLALVVRRFRTSQRTNGSWSYSGTRDLGQWGTSAMTCVGLLGLAVGHGLVANSRLARPISEDPITRKGLKHLAEFIEDKTPNFRTNHNRHHDFIYSLWSIERVAVLFNLSRIEGKDWYTWGVREILDHYSSLTQRPSPQLCMALLFFKRSNLVADLTRKIDYGGN